MRRIVLVDEVDYEKVEWGLTKNLVGPQTVGSKRIKVNITEYLPGYVHKPHSHPNQEEVIYILSGKGITEAEGMRSEIGPGSVVFIPAGVKHATLNLSDSKSLKAIVIKAPPVEDSWSKRAVKGLPYHLIIIKVEWSGGVLSTRNTENFINNLLSPIRFPS